MKIGNRNIMITEFRVDFSDLKIAEEHCNLKIKLGYKNVSLTKIDERFAVNWDRK
jgi:hypothetical protein